MFVDFDHLVVVESSGFEESLIAGFVLNSILLGDVLELEALVVRPQWLVGSELERWPLRDLLTSAEELFTLLHCGVQSLLLSHVLELDSESLRRDVLRIIDFWPEVMSFHPLLERFLILVDTYSHQI